VVSVGDWRNLALTGEAFGWGACIVLRQVPPLRGVSLFLASPRKSKQKEGDPGSVPAARVPCATRPSGRLAKLACGSDNASRKPPASLRCSAPLKGPGKASRLNWLKRLLAFSSDSLITDVFTFWAEPSFRDVFPGPLRGAEQRRKRRIKGEDCLRPVGPSSAAPAGFE
jgi:hypothetical protein